VRFLIYLFGTVFYSGRAPVAPGSAGSLLSLAILLLIARCAGPAAYSLALAAGILFMIIAGIPAASWIEKREGVKDAPFIVIDEAIGQWIAFLFIPAKLMISVWWVPLAGFLLFRFFDIVKIFPAKRAERLPRGLGVVMDDVVAGLYACAGLNLLVYYLV